jgi:hypothetical protein
MLIGNIGKRQEQFNIQEDGTGLFFVASRPGSVFFITGRPNQSSVFFVAANAAIGNIANAVNGLLGIDTPAPTTNTPGASNAPTNTGAPDKAAVSPGDTPPFESSNQEPPKPSPQAAEPQPNVDHAAADSTQEEGKKPGFVESVVESVFGALDGWLGW